MKTLIIILFFGWSAFSFGQKDYAKEILGALCSDFFAGRGYVDDGADKAASYLINQLKNHNVAPFPGRSYAQNYAFDVNTFPTKISVVLGEDTLEAGVDYLVNPNSGQCIGEYIPLVVNPKSIEKELKNALSSVSHRTVLVFDSRSILRKDSIQYFMGLAHEANKILPVIWITNQKLMYSVGRKQNKKAFVVVLGKAYKKSTTIRLNIKPEFKKRHESKNVIGYIPGRKMKKFIVITGHYDHLGKMGQAIFPGANDNASGTAMLLSLAKHYSLNLPKYSLVFIFFSGEEAGLEGSKYFVRHPFFELSQIRFLLNIDILGSASEGITAVNGTIHKKHFKLLQKLNKKGNYLPKIKPRGPTQNSDHFFFSQTGVPSFFVYSMGDCKNYHDVNDKSENTSLENFNETQLLFTKFIDKL
ncbi:MAG: M28 family metallopeptidase [Crocinitomicaceae bacterium]